MKKTIRHKRKCSCRRSRSHKKKYTRTRRRNTKGGNRKGKNSFFSRRGRQAVGPAESAPPPLPKSITRYQDNNLDTIDRLFINSQNKRDTLNQRAQSGDETADEELKQLTRARIARGHRHIGRRQRESDERKEQQRREEDEEEEKKTEERAKRTAWETTLRKLNTERYVQDVQNENSYPLEQSERVLTPTTRKARRRKIENEHKASLARHTLARVSKAKFGHARVTK